MSVEDLKKKRKKELNKKEEKVEVFTTSTCPYCIKIKKWLESENIDYEEHNVEESREKAKEMIEMSGQRGVPQTKVNDQVIVGFQPEKIKEAMSQ